MLFGRGGVPSPRLRGEGQDEGRGEKPRPIARPLSPALSDSTPRDGLGPNSFPGGAAEGARRAPRLPYSACRRATAAKNTMPESAVIQKLVGQSV